MSAGIVPPLPAYTLDPATIARKGEELGFEFIWYYEPPIFPVKGDVPFPTPYLSIGVAGSPWTLNFDGHRQSQISYAKRD